MYSRNLTRQRKLNNGVQRVEELFFNLSFSLEQGPATRARFADGVFPFRRVPISPNPTFFEHFIRLQQSSIPVCPFVQHFTKKFESSSMAAVQGASVVPFGSLNFSQNARLCGFVIQPIISMKLVLYVVFILYSVRSLHQTTDK